MLNRRHSSATHTCQCSFPSFCLLWKFLEMCFMFTREKTAIQNAKPTNHPTPCTFFFFFIEGKCAGNIERKPVSGWEEWIKEIKGKQQKKDFFSFQYYACVLLPGIVILRIRNSVHFGRKSWRWQLYAVTLGYVTVWAGHGFLNIYNSLFLHSWLEKLMFTGPFIKL